MDPHECVVGEAERAAEDERAVEDHAHQCAAAGNGELHGRHDNPEQTSREREAKPGAPEWIELPVADPHADGVPAREHGADDERCERRAVAVALHERSLRSSARYAGQDSFPTIGEDERNSRRGRTRATDRSSSWSWLSSRTRTYDEAIEAWHSHCPRLTVWEDALIDGLIRIERVDNGNSTVALTGRGRATLVRAEASTPVGCLSSRGREARRDHRRDPGSGPRTPRRT